MVQLCCPYVKEQLYTNISVQQHYKLQIWLSQMMSESMFIEFLGFPETEIVNGWSSLTTCYVRSDDDLNDLNPQI